MPGETTTPKADTLVQNLFRHPLSETPTDLVGSDPGDARRRGYSPSKTARVSAAAVRDEWAGWLSGAAWDLFVTLTDGGYPHPEAMLKRSRYFFSKVNDELYGKNWQRRGEGVEYVTGIELQKRGSCHTHSLARLPNHDVRDREQFSLASWQRFATSLGGFAWLEIPKSTADITAYVTKYVLKDGELVLSPNLNPWQPRTFGTSLLGGG